MWAVFCAAGGSRHCLSPGPTYTRRHGGGLFLMHGESHPHLPRDKGALEEPGVPSSKGGDAFFERVLSRVLLFTLGRCCSVRSYGPSSPAGSSALEAPGSFSCSSAQGFSSELLCPYCSLLQLKSYLQICLFLICTALTFTVPVHVMAGRIYCSASI